MPDNFGNRLKRLRKKAGLTQEQLAEAVGVNPITISWWENNKFLPKTQSIKALAKAFDVSEAELLNDPPAHNTGEWVITIETKADFKQEAINLKGNIQPMCQITVTPEGCGFTIKADWDTLQTKKGLEKLLKQVISDFYPAIRGNGIAYKRIQE